MSDAQVIEIMTSALNVAAQIAGPLLGVALAVGVGVSLLQTITQIQEMTLTFVPKLVGAGAVLLVSGKWMLHQMVAWVQSLWALIPGV